MFLAGIVVLICLVCASNFQHTVGNVILAGTVGFHDSFNEVLRNIGVVGKELLSILGQAIATIAERRVVVVATNARIEADTFNNLLGI